MRNGATCSHPGATRRQCLHIAQRCSPLAPVSSRLCPTAPLSARLSVTVPSLPVYAHQRPSHGQCVARLSHLCLCAMVPASSHPRATVHISRLECQRLYHCLRVSAPLSSTSRRDGASLIMSTRDGAHLVLRVSALLIPYARQCSSHLCQCATALSHLVYARWCISRPVCQHPSRQCSSVPVSFMSDAQRRTSRSARQRPSRQCASSLSTPKSAVSIFASHPCTTVLISSSSYLRLCALALVSSTPTHNDAHHIFVSSTSAHDGTSLPTSHSPLISTATISSTPHPRPCGARWGPFHPISSMSMHDSNCLSTSHPRLYAMAPILSSSHTCLCVTESGFYFSYMSKCDSTGLAPRLCATASILSSLHLRLSMQRASTLLPHA
jgi:hypothetical protein